MTAPALCAATRDCGRRVTCHVNGKPYCKRHADRLPHWLTRTRSKENLR